MKRIKLTVAYDGTNYCGWQVQPNGITIEEVLNKKLSKLTGEDIHIIGASRTDSGVHALGNVAVFDTTSTIPPERFAYAINQRLPEDIVVTQSEEVPMDWHPRYQDCIKYYEYHILNRSLPDPLKRLTTSHVSFPLDEAKMQEAANYLIGTHDFKSFCNIRTNTDDTVRTIYSLDVVRDGEEITIYISGNGFLYNMVRAMTGTIVYAAEGKLSPEDIPAILASGNRTLAGPTVPPGGLYMTKLWYEEDVL